MTFMRISSMMTYFSCFIINDDVFQLFEERKVLIGHWFENWTDAQRRQFLEHLVEKFNKVSFLCKILNIVNPRNIYIVHLIQPYKSAHKELF